jgi:hypothetical protein
VSTRQPVVIALVVLLGLCPGGYVSAAVHTNDGPTAVYLKSVDAIPGACYIEVRWSTYAELDTAGFNVMRSTSEAGPWEQANESAILALGGEHSEHDYSFVDNGVTVGVTYYYYIQEILESGGTQDYAGEWIRSAKVEGAYLPLILNR